MEPLETELLAVQPPRKPRVWTVFLAFAALLLAHAFVGLILVVIFLVARLVGSGVADSALQDQAQVTRTIKEVIESSGFILASLLTGALLDLLLAFVPAKLSTIPWRQRIRLRPARISPRVAVTAVLVFLAISTVSDALFGAMGWKADGTLGALSRTFSNDSLPALLIGALLMAFGAGFCEELFFRGYVQTRLCQRWGRWIGIVVTAALFGVMHMDPVQSVCAFGVALFLGWITERTGSIRPAMAAHAFNNFAWTLSVGFMGTWSRAANGVLLVFLVVASVVGVLFLRKALPDCGKEPRPSDALAFGAPLPPTA